jgi:hypothetical protein
LRKAVQSIRKTTGDTADFAEILKIWEKQLTIAASDRPKYWKQSAQEELQQAFELRYQSLLKKMAMRQEETKQE